ncbi:polysaccharide lyase family 8 super-sandwich domain-containing protein [Fluviicola sp.]|uniref:polysaccharide lyase family 8 super-sandwich domain-containing protein n=1 Tax=Fluviicola sp. TaxID=1917219 RepID=UPI002622E585|nr:polysaccharide lyase family 8 super-sandwich domain-containing protein [Fluviicola sp.]
MKQLVALILIIFLSDVSFSQQTAINNLKEKYIEWLIGTPTDYNTPEVVERYNRYITNGNNARDLSAYNFQNPGAVWDLTQGADRSAYSTLVESKLIRLVMLYKLQGPAGSPNPSYNSPGLKDTILDIFQYLKNKGVNASTNFNMYENASLEMIEIYNSVALRSSAYSASILLMKEELKLAGEFDHHMGALNQLTSFLRSNNPLFNFTYPGFNTDVIRSTSVQRFCYILALDDTVSARPQEMMHFKNFMNNAMKISRGWSDCIRPDFITYHHKGAYTNSYGINALQILSILNWTLSGSPYELNPEAQSNLRNAVLNYSKLCIDFEMPRGTSGRFPTDLSALSSLRLAHAYLYLSNPVQNVDCGKEFIRLWGISSPQNTNLIRSATTSINLLNGLQGPRHFMETIQSGLPAAVKMEGHFGFPYAGSSVHKRLNFQLNFKGSSKYIWDYENSATENVFGRYLSAGGMDILCNTSPVSYDGSGLALVGWDWSHFPGTTATYLPFGQLGPATHRLFSKGNFIGNASLDQNGTFVLDYRDNYSTTRMSALKSYFAVDNKILCMGSAIQDTNGIAPIHTTLFQTRLVHQDSATYVNGVAQTGLATDISQVGGGIRMTDAMGNGYIVPNVSANTDEIRIKREIQNSMNQSNTAATSGNFASAYINHGTAPLNAGYHYLVVVKGNAAEIQAVAQQPTNYFEVLQCDRKAHAAKYVPDSIFSYAVFDTTSVFLADYLRKVNHPSVILTQAIDSGDKLKISATNPDLGMLNESEFYQYNQIGNNPAVQYRIPQPEMITITLAGEWELDQSSNGLSISSDGTLSYLEVETLHGTTVQTLLKKVLPSTNSLTENGVEQIKMYPNPSDGKVYINLDYTQIKTWEVSDSKGSKLKGAVLSPSDSHKTLIDLGNPASGIYYLRLTQSNQTSLLKLIIR